MMKKQKFTGYRIGLMGKLGNFATVLPIYICIFSLVVKSVHSINIKRSKKK